MGRYGYTEFKTLPGALLDLAERDDGAAAMVDRLMRNLPRDQDRKAFEGWDAPRPGRAGETDGEGESNGEAPSPAPSCAPVAPASST